MQGWGARHAWAGLVGLLQTTFGQERAASVHLRGVGGVGGYWVDAMVTGRAHGRAQGIFTRAGYNGAVSGPQITVWCLLRQHTAAAAVPAGACVVPVWHEYGRLNRVLLLQQQSSTSSTQRQQRQHQQPSSKPN